MVTGALDSMGRSATDCTAGIWHRPFLAAFSNSGNIGASARNARIHRQTVHKALERDQTFREKFEKDKEEAILQLETKLHELALAGSFRRHSVWHSWTSQRESCAVDRGQ